MFTQRRFELSLFQFMLKLLKRLKLASEHAMCSQVFQAKFVHFRLNYDSVDVFLALCKIDRVRFQFPLPLKLDTN